MPISPKTMESGTNTSSSTTSLKWWPPFIETMGRTSAPGAFRSTMNWLRPACRCAGSTGSVRASTMNACARCAPDVHTLVPVIDQPPSARDARVRTLARSEPESGSLIPIPKKHSPRTMRGRYVDFWSSVPYFNSDGTICRSAIQCAATGAPAASSSSVTTNRSSKERPWPPYCAGTVMPSHPRRASSAVKFSSHPHSQESTDGVKAPAASCSARNSRTWRRNSKCESLTSFSTSRSAADVRGRGGPAAASPRPWPASTRVTRKLIPAAAVWPFAGHVAG
ncbi:Uncharacterised protein [Mycolicibacterium fortuitum]|uniref:Uncharacterized protein n=1 Tax=Mycolicibacterium fortuitum TaxID=1766 RepID=A0A378V3J9_MYCFO|nr:Uncharacterised protein [Mycolicibacterium fortuitum]